MKNLIGALLIIVGIALIFTEGQRSGFEEEYDHSLNDIEADRDTDIADPEADTEIRLQPVLGVVLILGGAGVLFIAYKERNPG